MDTTSSNTGIRKFDIITLHDVLYNITLQLNSNKKVVYEVKGCNSSSHIGLHILDDSLTHCIHPVPRQKDVAMEKPI